MPESRLGRGEKVGAEVRGGWWGGEWGDAEFGGIEEGSMRNEGGELFTFLATARFASLANRSPL